MKIEIEKIGGKWLVNGNDHSQMSALEKELLNTFFKEYKNENTKAPH